MLRNESRGKYVLVELLAELDCKELNASEMKELVRKRVYQSLRILSDELDTLSDRVAELEIIRVGNK